MKVGVPLFFPWNHKLSGKGKGEEIFCFTCWNIKLINLEAWTYSFTVEGQEGPKNFFMDCLKEV